jgi:hypothetical protein
VTDGIALRRRQQGSEILSTASGHSKARSRRSLRRAFAGLIFENG